MDYTYLNSSNVPASFVNDLQSAEELYFRKDREISDNDENEFSDSESGEESDESCNHAETSRDCDTTIEWRGSDITENQKVESFLKEGCGCLHDVEEENCSNRFSVEKVLTHRQVCLEMSSSELDMVVLSQLEACTRQDENSRSSQQTTKRKRTRTYFTFEGKLHYLVLIIITNIPVVRIFQKLY